MGEVVVLVVDVLTDVSSSGASAPGQPAVTSTTAATTAARTGTTRIFERRPGLEVVLFDVMPTP